MNDDVGSASDLVNDFLKFLAGSPTPFHAVNNLKQLLMANGFSQIQENERWSLKGEGRYFVIRNGSVIGFTLAKDYLESLNIRMIGAHTDSPCLKVKPQPDKSQSGYKQLGVEVYGGVLLNPWFDRDLSIAGQVSYLTDSGGVKQALVNFERPVALIPSLAIHLNRTVNENKSVNAQKEMSAILLNGDNHPDFRELLKAQILAGLEVTDIREVLDFNLCFYDTQKPSLAGLDNQFLVSARLDNLLSCYIAARALVSQTQVQTSLVVCNDHEEVGSLSCAGAQGTMLADTLSRIFPDPETRQRAMRQSLMLSSDNAHGVHPNYANYHDEQHGPLLNKGPVVKFDVNQSYATDDRGAALVRWLAKQAPEIPLQRYVTRADMRCGSTIGPMTAAGVGIPVVDLGVPTFAMHSIRETAGREDLEYLLVLFERFMALKSFVLN